MVRGLGALRLGYVADVHEGEAMTSPALVRSADLKRMASIAKREGVRVEIEIDGKIVRVAPDIPVDHRSELVDEQEIVRL